MSYQHFFDRRNSGFSPKDISGLQLWLDANAPSSVQSDGAANFTAANTQYLTAGKALLSSGAFTFATWIKFTTAGTTVRFMSNSVTGSTDRQFINISSSKFGCTAGTTAQGGTTTVSTGTWYFVVFTNDGVSSTLYLNNAVEVAAFADAPVYTSVNNFYIGSGQALTTTLNGAMDSTGVWNRVLTAAEMTYLYNAGAGRVYADLGQAGTNGSALGTSLTAWWDMDAEIGTRFDKSGNGNHLTASNTTIISNSPATLNGGFETAGAGGADVFASWVESVSGTTTINDETVTFHSGANALRFDIDATPHAGTVQQTVCTVGNYYSVSLWAQTSSGTGTLFYGSNTGVGSKTFTISSGSYVQYSSSFTASDTTFLLQAGAGAASKSVYIDDVVLTDLGPVGVAGIAAGTATDGNFCASFAGGATTQSLDSSWATASVANTGSVSIWFFISSTESQNGRILNIGDSGGGFVSALDVYISGGTTSLGASLYNASVDLMNMTGKATQTGWNHLVITWSGTAVIAYLNGASIFTSSGNKVANFSGTTHIRFGNYLGGSNCFNGRLDAAGIWSKELTPTEVTALLNAGQGLKYAGLTGTLLTSLVSYYDFDRKAGITVDSAGTNTLTNTGSVAFAQGVNYFAGVAKKWVDQSGSNNHAVQTTQSGRPAWQSSVQNGKPGILFDGISSTLSLTGMSIPAGNFTFFVAFNPTTTTTAKYIFDTGTGRMVFAQGSGSGTPTKVGWFDGSWHDIANATTGVQILTFNLNSTGTAGAIYRNASQLGSSAAYTQTAIGASVAIGSAFGANGNFLTGTIYEIILYTSALSAANQTRVLNYLNAKYAIY